jgi:hypothetical protein
MTTPTPPRDLSEHDRAGIAGTIHECDPAAVERLRALMAQQQPPRWLEARRRQYNGDRIVSHLRQAAQAHAAKVRLVLSDDQMTDIDQRRADGESWAGLARALNMTQTTLMAAYARQTAAKRQDGQQCR